MNNFLERSNPINKGTVLGELSRLLFLECYTVNQVKILLDLPYNFTFNNKDLEKQVNIVKSICNSDDLSMLSEEYETSLKDRLFSFIRSNICLDEEKFKYIYEELHRDNFSGLFFMIKNCDDSNHRIQVNHYAFPRDNLASCIKNNCPKILDDINNFESFDTYVSGIQLN